MSEITPDWTHNDLRNHVLLKLSEQGWLCWANNTGFGWTFDKKRPLRAGLQGSTDIIALRPPVGKGYVVEIKVGKDTLRGNQQDFRDAALRVGAHHAVVHLDTYERDIEMLLNAG